MRLAQTTVHFKRREAFDRVAPFEPECVQPRSARRSVQ
jgi:hypothetical protein